MLAVKSTHKRKRSSARRDASHGTSTAARSIVSHVVPAAHIDAQAANIASSSSHGARTTAARVSRERLEGIIDRHPFNHELHLLVPTSDSADIERTLAAASAVQSYVARISPCLFLDPLFVAAHLKRGQLTVLSVGQLDQDDVFCIDGQGRLHLSLTKDTYQTLGLQGQALKASQTSSGWAGDRTSGAAERYFVTIDLLASFFTPGRPAWERTMRCFKAWDEARGDAEHMGSWDVLMSWCSDEDSLGETIHFPAQRFHDSKSVHRVDTQRTTTTLNDVWIPDTSALELTRGWSEAQDGADNTGRLTLSDWHERLHGLSEWGALCMLQADCVHAYARPDHISAYEVAVPRLLGSLVHVCYRGLLPSNLARSVIKAMASKQDEHGLVGVLQAVGFADAPVAWCTPRVEASLEEDLDSDDQDEDEQDTGVGARRKRNKKRRQRGYTRPEHLGVQVRNAHSTASSSGWQAVLLAADEGSSKHGKNDDVNSKDRLHCLVIENLGDTQRS